MNARTSLSFGAFIVLAVALASVGCKDTPTGTGATAGMQGNGNAGAGGTDPNATMGLSCADGSHPVLKADGSVMCADGSIPTGTPGGTSGGMDVPPDPPAKCTAEACGPNPFDASPQLCTDGSIGGPVCEGAADGYCAWSTRECPTTPEPQSCGSRGLRECPMGQFCFFQPGADCGRADAPGVCADYPTVCTMQLNPVCGCDGNDYENICLAASQGVGIDHEGACKTDGGGEICGGFAGFPCPMGQFCDYAFCPDLVADGSGVCREQPTACTKEYAPVCGCDGKTYGNKCAAAAAGVSISKTGECAAVSNKCGDSTCSDAEYCHRAVGECAGPGGCMKRPEVCTAIFAPVCGCDGKDYSSACDANSHGSGVLHEGECK